MALTGQLPLDWAELWRVAARPEYGILAECRTLVNEVAHELNLPSPADPA